MNMMKEKFISLENAIGNTPLAKIVYTYKGRTDYVFTKLEHYNLTGSIKDRVALFILKDAYENGLIKQGYKISEATSGNTGIAFSAVGKFLGNSSVIFMPDWMSEERKNLMKCYDAELILVSKEEGGFLESIARSKEYAAKNKNVFLPLQFENEKNVECHEFKTGAEIVKQLSALDLTADAFICGVGTGGTVMGIGKAIKKTNKKAKVFPAEPSSSPTLTTGHKTGHHRISGISDEFIPDIVKLNQLDEIVQTDDGDAIILTQKLSKELGMGVGISSGFNLLSAIKIKQKYNFKNVITVFPDDNKKYFSTDYTKIEKVKETYLSPEIKLENIIIYK